jgi:uncharacterized membrane protein
MIELIFVIIVLGVVASIGSRIIAKVYKRYIITQAINKIQQKSEYALEFIEKRLEHRIKDSVITRKSSGAYISLLSSEDKGGYTILEWIGTSYESMASTKVPGWSGLIDLESPNT